MNGRNPRQGRAQRALEPRPVHVALRIARIRPELLPGDAAPAAVRLQELGKTGCRGHQHPRRRRGVRERSLVGEHLGMRPGKTEAHDVAVVLRGEDAAHGLLLQPLAGVARVHAGASGELVDRQRVAAGQHAVQPEPVADVHGEGLHAVEHLLEDPRCEGVDLRGVADPGGRGRLVRCSAHAPNGSPAPGAPRRGQENTPEQDDACRIVLSRWDHLISRGRGDRPHGIADLPREALRAV